MADTGRGFLNGINDAIQATEDELQVIASGAGGKLKDYKRILNSSLSRIMLFLFVVVPIVFLALMHVGGFMMVYEAEWTFERGYNLMAAAMTGGAIILPADPPEEFAHKTLLSVAACFGVGIFGFTVAVLSNSLVGPLVHALGIEVTDSEDQDSHDESSRKVIYRLFLLAVGIMVFNIFAAAVFGLFMCYAQGWTFLVSFKTMASLVLGGGIPFHNMGEPTKEGRLLYTIVGICSWSMSGLVVAVAGDPGHKLVSKAIGIKLDEGATPTQALRMLLMLVFVVMPLSILCVMIAVATIMKVLSPWSFEGGFWTALPAISGGAANLTHVKNPPLNLFGAFIITCCGSGGWFVVSIMMGVGGEMVGPIVEGPILGPYLGTKRTVAHSCAALFAISAVAIPILVFLNSIFVGLSMSWVMDWEFVEGMLWCVDVQLGGGMDLVTKTPTTIVGGLFEATAVAWSLGIAIAAIGLSGSPVVEPLIDYLGMTIDPADLEAIEAAKKALENFEGEIEDGLDRASSFMQDAASETSYGATT